MLRLLALLCVGVIPIHGRTFNNPIIGVNISEPSAIKVNNTYYIVTATNDTTSNKFPIYMSTDLTSWKLTGHIFDESNIPRWTAGELPFLSPRLHKIGDNYHVYFTATDSTTNLSSIGVAIAPNPAGPYTATDRPLLSDTSEHVRDASIINDAGDLYLIWVTQNSIKGRKLNSNGLSFYATFSTDLVPSRTDRSSTGGPWYISRGVYHYLIYSVNNYSNQTLHVSRSSYPLGPYDEKNQPILVSNDKFKGPGHASFVKDTDNISDVIVFHGLRKGEDGVVWPRVILSGSVTWDETNYSYDSQNWPCIRQF